MKAAILQLDVLPAPTLDRLERANHLVEQACGAGAQLILMPELFNTGYTYSPENFHRTETSDGPTLAWMKASANRLGVHLSGTLLLKEGGEIYNAFLLVAPDGHTWRYDKTYPWAYERAYFRGGKGLTIAETALGRVGMLVCWDAGHPRLWRGYAGKVDFILLASCPPNFDEMQYRLPDGKYFTNAELGPVMRSLRGTVDRVFTQGVAEQAAWLGAPVISSTACGIFHSSLPNARGLFPWMLPFAPWLWRYRSLIDQMEVTCPVYPAGQVLDTASNSLVKLSPDQGEAYCMADVGLTGRTPEPQGRQPGNPVPWITYALADGLLPALCRRIYRASGLSQG